jgi:hypothetical protein
LKTYFPLKITLKNYFFFETTLKRKIVPWGVIYYDALGNYFLSRVIPKNICCDALGSHFLPKATPRKKVIPRGRPKMFLFTTPICIQIHYVSLDFE